MFEMFEIPCSTIVTGERNKNKFAKILKIYQLLRHVEKNIARVLRIYTVKYLLVVIFGLIVIFIYLFIYVLLNVFPITL